MHVVTLRGYIIATQAQAKLTSGATEYAVLNVKTSPLRDILTEANIFLLAAVAKFEEADVILRGEQVENRIATQGENS